MMSHRFSNPARTRKELLDKAKPEWHELPQELRVLILEDIQLAVEEVLNESTIDLKLVLC